MTAATTIRPAVVADAEALLRLHVRARLSYYRGFVDDERLAEENRRDPADYELMIEAPDRTVWCAETRGQLAGFLTIGRPYHAEPDADSELYQIQVDPAYHRHGIGTALHRAAVAGWRARGVATARLWVWEFNERAREFYRHHGWRPDGRPRPDDPRIGEYRMIGLKLSVPPDTHSP